MSVPSPSVPSDPPFPLTAKDHEILSLPPESFEPHTWSSLRDLIASNDLASLRRHPSDLRRYIRWTAATKAAYGSITAYICQERLHWEPLPPKNHNTNTNNENNDDDDGPHFPLSNPTHPLTSPHDFKILPNDWPYAFEPGITHLVVWLKHRLPVQQGAEEEGDLTPQARALVDAFVEERFRRKVGKERVMWFRNWTGLQSVRGLEHVHVLVRGVGREGVEALLVSA